MKIQPIDNSQNFEGKLITLGKFSSKPASVLENLRSDLEKLIKNKKFDLYVKQDYSADLVRFGGGTVNPFAGKMTDSVTIPIVSKSAKYKEAAENAITLHEKDLYNKEQTDWESKQKRQKKEDLKDAAGIVIFFPLFVINDILHSINPKWANKFEKYIDKII